MVGFSFFFLLFQSMLCLDVDESFI